MIKSICLGAACCVFSLAALAQENLVGSWSGSYRFQSNVRDTSLGVELEVTSVEGNVVKGKFKNLSGGACAGEYPMAGKLNGNELGMASTETGGAQKDCKMAFRVTVDGNKMTGKMGRWDLQMNKK